VSVTSMNPRTAALFAAAIALGIVIPAVFWIAQGAVAGLITAGWGWVTIAAFYFGFRRSDAVQIVSGMGDERIRSLHLRALAFAGFVMWAVLVAWWLVSAAGGHENESVGILLLTFGLSYIAGAAYLGRRDG
jgi:hypothetical protein